MKSIVLKAIMNRYNGFVGLFQAMRECEDTVLVNLADDIKNEYTEDEILTMIEKTF